MFGEVEVRSWRAFLIDVCDRFTFSIEALVLFAVLLCLFALLFVRLARHATHQVTLMLQ